MRKYVNTMVVAATGAVAALASQAAFAYEVPTYLSGALTEAGAAFGAIIALVAVGVLAATLGKGGLHMVINWVGRFFSGR